MPDISPYSYDDIANIKDPEVRKRWYEAYDKQGVSRTHCQQAPRARATSTRCMRCAGLSGNAQADNIFRTLFANKRIHILGGANPPLDKLGRLSKGKRSEVGVDDGV